MVLRTSIGSMDGGHLQRLITPTVININAVLRTKKPVIPQLKRNDIENVKLKRGKDKYH
ncbi:MAG TPA: hypothetical protein VFX18_00455 [Candidatus Nitrosocosmicus sp.]|nr:hypothetical protein [Candidatus Nitrosocosmicus sp.]